LGWQRPRNEKTKRNSLRNPIGRLGLYRPVSGKERLCRWICALKDRLVLNQPTCFPCLLQSRMASSWPDYQRNKVGPGNLLRCNNESRRIITFGRPVLVDKQGIVLLTAQLHEASRPGESVWDNWGGVNIGRGFSGPFQGYAPFMPISVLT
jgi:hypothetical protein